MGATPNIFCPEISKSFEYFKTNSGSSSLLEIATRYFSVLNLESLGFYVGTFVPTIFLQAHSLRIWPGNSKSNGGPLSK